MGADVIDAEQQERNGYSVLDNTAQSMSTLVDVDASRAHKLTQKHDEQEKKKQTSH